MTTSTQSLNTCSAGSERIYIPRLRASRILLLWWWALHGVGVAGIISLPISWLNRCVLLVLVAGHGLKLAPELSPVLVRYPNGLWSAPEIGRGALRLGVGSGYAGWWLRLILHDADGTLKVLLLRDQFQAPEWRALQAAFRRLPGASNDA